jgi:hypothetical protein
MARSRVRLLADADFFGKLVSDLDQAGYGYIIAPRPSCTAPGPEQLVSEMSFGWAVAEFRFQPRRWETGTGSSGAAAAPEDPRGPAIESAKVGRFAYSAFVTNLGLQPG